MASSPPNKRKPPSGVRGPGGPGGPPKPSGGSRGSSPKSGWRRRLEAFSFPALRAMSRLPRFVIVVIPAVLLLLGLIQTGPLTWLGGILLLIVFILLAWLTLLSWPAISTGSRFSRVIVLAALLGIVFLKFAGRF